MRPRLGDFPSAHYSWMMGDGTGLEGPGERSGITMFIHLALWAVVGLGAGPGRLATATGILEPGGTAVVTVPAPDEARARSVVISLEQPGRLAPAAPIEATIAFG